jgi:galactokinase
VRTARAPGRVTLIGEHTDYNAGLSLPRAIDLTTQATFLPTPGTFLVGLTSDRYPEPWEIPLGPSSPTSPQSVLATALVRLSNLTSGGSINVTSTLPVGAGLSSSAAFSVALLLALGSPPIPRTIATLCQAAEATAGSHVGLLDPLAMMEAQAGHAVCIDFATLESHQVAIPEEAAFVVVHCGTARQLSASPYATRRAECELAANHIGRPLGRCDMSDLSAVPEPVLRRRARHVITECGRVREVERLLGWRNLAGVGAVMTDGHRSQAEDFKVSIPVVDELVEHLIGLPGVHGARMTGGGFGGCVIALCEPDSPALDAEAYAPRLAWRISPSPGAALLAT